MTDKEFCRIETSFSGEGIDKVEQLGGRTFNGRELKEYLEHAFAILAVGNRRELLIAKCREGFGYCDTEDMEVIDQFLKKESNL